MLSRACTRLWFGLRGCVNFFLARVSRSTNANPGNQQADRGSTSRLDDVISRSTDWRKTSQVRLPTSASRLLHYTHRKKKNCWTLRRGKNLTFGSGRKLKSQDLREKESKGRGRIGGDGHTVDPYVRHNTVTDVRQESIPGLLTEPRRLAVLCLPSSSLKGHHVHKPLVDKLLAVELSLLLLL